MTYDQRNLAPTVHATHGAAAGWRGTGRLLPCTGWFGNSARVRAGLRPAGHSWQRGEPSNPDDRCMVCDKHRRDVMELKPISLQQALKGN